MPDGQARVFGDFPESENRAYFIQTNDTNRDPVPGKCSENTPLDWNIGAETLMVYAVYGTMTGENTFDLTGWKTGTGGSWEKWYVDAGALKIVTE